MNSKNRKENSLVDELDVEYYDIEEPDDDIRYLIQDYKKQSQQLTGEDFYVQ